MSIVLCWNCGKPATGAVHPGGTCLITDNRSPLQRQFCDECRENHIKELETIRTRYAIDKKRLMLERAVVSLEKQGFNLYQIKDIIDQMQDYVAQEPDKIESTAEMITAIILASEEIRAIPQKQIGAHRVDFYLPEYKIILEVDGYFHGDSKKDSRRDITLRATLGNDWEVVRIPTKYVEGNAKKLVDAIFEIKEHKQRERRKYKGFTAAEVRAIK